MALLQEVEKVSISILMDNSTDFLLINSAHAVRPTLIINEKFNLPPPVAEHGFSALVNVVSMCVQIKVKLSSYIPLNQHSHIVYSKRQTKIQRFKR